MRRYRSPAIIAAAQKGLRPCVTLGVLIGCLIVLQPGLAAVTPEDITQAFSRVSPVAWMGALLATALSFAALGAYDVLIHRWLATGVPTRRAALSGAAAIGVSQTIGFGLFSGTVARARLLPNMTLLGVGRITLVVASRFVVALAVTLSLAAVVLGAPRGMPTFLIPLGLGLVALGVGLSLAQPRWLPFRMPSLLICGGVLLATTLDTGLATLAFWLLLPDSAAISFAVLLPAFLLALGAGIMSGTPAGLGPFEVSLLALLPTLPDPELLCTIIAFRMVYFALPAMVAGFVLIFGAHGLGKATTPTPTRPAPPKWAEAGLAHQGELHWTNSGDRTLKPGETGQCLVAVGRDADNPGAFASLARSRGLIPAFYKCNARGAAAARRQGWRGVRIADEMVLDVADYDTSEPARRRLRRKLRAAARSGVCVKEAPHVLPMDNMARIAKAWSDARGGEKGFSMGRFAPDYVAHQRVFLAYRDGALLGFVTFHTTANTAAKTVDTEWTLDLVRVADGAPDGTMFALVDAALGAAAKAGVARLSLAAVPSGLAAALAARLGVKSGLAQFKRAFAPRSDPLYLVAPHWFGLILAAVDITRRIHRTCPMPRAKPASNLAKEDYDEFEFAKMPAFTQKPRVLSP